ncbi:MAG: prolyl oligopeptidase family serine peptidase [Candidatus Thorarchaeota archaeon]
MKNSQEKFTAEDFAKLRFPNSPALSPNGEKVVFSIRRASPKKGKGEKSTYKAPLYLKEKGETGYRQLTVGTHVDTAPKFSPCGEYLAFLSSRSEKGMQVCVMSTSGGEALPITNFPVGVKDFAWSQDSQSIHVIALVTEQELQEILNPPVVPSFVLDPVSYDGHMAKKSQLKKLIADPKVTTEAYCREATYYLQGRFTQPFIVPVVLSTDERDNEKKRPVHIGEFGCHYELGTFSIDNQSVLISKHKGDPALTLEREILEINISDPKEVRVLGPAFGFLENFRISPNGQYLSFEGRREERGIYDDLQIFLYDLEDNMGEFQVVTENFDRSVQQSQWISNSALLFASPRNGQVNIHRIDIETKEILEVVGDNRNINSFSASKNGDKIAFEVSHSSFPADIFWCDGDGANEERITNANQKFLETHTPAAVKPFSYQRDGIDFQGWLLLPPDHNGKDQLPVILEMHGGPAAHWTPHEKTLWHEWNVLVSQGYAVVFCNPRGSDGYGIEFRGAVFKNWGDLPGNDILMALDTALEKYSFLDRNNLAVTGGSYGGYMTAWLVTHSNRFKAAVSQRGVYEYAAFGTTTDIPIWLERQYDADLIEQSDELLRDAPLLSIKNLETPLLIIHSENDFRVPIATAEMLFWAAKRYGKTVEFVRYPRDGHELSRSGEPRHIIDRINRIEKWISKHLQLGDRVD